MLKHGSWWLRSESDPRWNVSGEGQVGMFMGLNECRPAKAEYDRLKAQFGEPPDDLEFGYHKH